jgi:predicted ribosomally synthesized peptide with nif11-like leader
MSRESLNNFVHAAKHSFSLRQKLKDCKEDPHNILKLAKSYGFSITRKDLAEDEEAERIEGWFKASLISPLKTK